MANVVLVGANTGIGFYMAERLLEQRHTVTVLDVETRAVRALERRFPEQAMVLEADARDAAGICDGVRQAVVRFGQIDAAVHNACLCTFGDEVETEEATYRAVMEVNFYGALHLAKAVLPFMRKAQKGRVVFTNSGVGVTGFAGISPYAASKGAIEALAKCLAIENEDKGISFHLMHPPLTDTASAAALPVPKEFKADARKVGRGLAEHLWDTRFIICHSWMQAAQMAFSYRHPLFIGRLMTKMTKRAVTEKE